MSNFTVTKKESVLDTAEKERIYNNMVDLLDEYDYSYTKPALEKIITVWYTNKKVLIDMFSTHPNWMPEQYALVFDTDYEREIDRDAVRAFYNWVLTTANINPGNPIAYGVFTQLYDRTIDKFAVDAINSNMPYIKVQVGTKTTRVVNKICKILSLDKNPEYNERYARYADALSPVKIKRHTIISVNPLDYLTMSFGNSWASCHTIDTENKRCMPNHYNGQYSSGTLSYMLDAVSFIMYTVSEHYTGSEYWQAGKINRQMYHYDNGLLIQGRLYPVKNDGSTPLYDTNRTLVQEILANLLKVPNLWVKGGSVPASGRVYSIGTHYRDYNCYDSCTISWLKDTDSMTTITIGHDPICVECGHEHNTSENINCCNSRYFCERCGEAIDPDDVIYVNGEMYCRDCVAWCDHCNEYVPMDNITYLDNYQIYVCDDCLYSYFTRCDECGEYCNNDDILLANKHGFSVDICRNCMEDYYYFCERCDDLHHVDDIHEYDDSIYCKDCYAEILKDVEKEVI